MIRICGRRGRRSKGVLHIDGERENRVLGGILTLDRLGQEDPGTALVYRGKRDRFVIHVVRGIVELIGSRAIRKRMPVIDLDEHRFIVVDQHRVNSRDVEFPIVGNTGFTWFFHKCEVMAFRPSQRLPVFTHDTDGNIDSILPVITIGKRNRVYFYTVTSHHKINRRMLLIISDKIRPVFCDRKLLNSTVFHSRRIFKGRFTACSRITSRIFPGKCCRGVGLQLAVGVNVIPDIRVQPAPGALVILVHVGIVLDIRNDIKGFLAGIDDKGDLISHTVQQSAKT